jgi:RNA polymerase sigma-70 factor (ECF subfamily)
MMTVEATATMAVEDPAAPAERITRLFTAHRRRLYALARRLSSSSEDACDLVQETFLRAARTPRTIPEGVKAEEAWLVRVLVNLCRDRWRQRKVRRRLDSSVDRGPQQTRLDAETPLLAREMVWRALEALSPRRRAVIIMREIEGASMQEIARLLGVTAVTVRWHHSQGCRELRRILERAGERGTRR